ncbi:amidase domain-containing protein [Microbacterium sp. W1N]|uniref:amidase domain-containing protein n=1 Tax=Microbacterium festucae TaxID=2977531 RepID=UPI0021C0DE36|nr:amidase domain-containing protein [Microbacterium festucae]MCT9819192.1 amidase domain-containing protein [Microbacterium festucae]
MSTPPTRSARRRRNVRRRRVLAGVVSVIIVAALTVGIFGFVRSLGERAQATPDTTPAANASTPTPEAAAPPSFDTAAAADQAMAVLADYSDAARATEDALYQATQKLRSATTAADADAAQAETQQAVDAVKADAEAYRAQITADAAGTNTQPAGGDVAAQMAYLHQYVFSYNSAEWGDYNPYGGDCTNFTSQGLIARGWHIDGTWYSKGAMWTASKPWIATAPMAAYFDKLGFGYSTEADLDRVRVGDVGLFSWGETQAGMDHTMTVSKVEYVPGGPPVVSFISHNSDGEYRELTHALYVEHTDSTVRIYHIP